MRVRSPVNARFPLSLAMRAWPAGAALLAALLAVLAYLSGPRPPPLRPAPTAALPADLDAYLRAREAQHDDLRPDAAAHVRWFHAEPGRRTPLGLVYIHGFSASHRETHPYAEQLADRLRANLYQSRLRGHGRDPAAMGEASAGDWLADLAEARAIARRIGERTVLIGTSQGGALALLSAVDDPADLAAVVVVSPNFGITTPAAGLLSGPWGEHIAQLVLAADEHGFTPVNAEHARHWTTRYPIRALVAMQQVVDALQAAPLERIRAPVLAFYSRRDRVVDPEALRHGIARVGSQHLWLVRLDEATDPQGHVLIGDILSPAATAPAVDITLGFLQRLGGGAARGGGAYHAPRSCAAAVARCRNADYPCPDPEGHGRNHAVAVSPRQAARGSAGRRVRWTRRPQRTPGRRRARQRSAMATPSKAASAAQPKRAWRRAYATGQQRGPGWPPRRSGRASD